MNQFVHRYTRNTEGNDYIVGDVHGNYTGLMAHLYAIGFDEKKDRLFILGDLVGRGKESMEMVEFSKLPFVKCVLGNHEQMNIDWSHGIGDFLNMRDNGEGWFTHLDKETQKEVAAQFQSFPIVIELETSQGILGLVHAECPLNHWPDFVAMLESPDTDIRKHEHLIMCALWSRDRNDRKLGMPVTGVRAIVVGHTPDTEMRVLGNHIYIDTYGWFPRNGKFTVLNAETLEIVRNQ